MENVIKDWYRRYFSDQEAIILFFILAIGLGLIIYMGHILGPFIASVVIAYLLQWLVNILVRCGIKEIYSVLLVYLGFLGIFAAAVLVLGPLLWQQMALLFKEFPNMLTKLQHFFQELHTKYPQYVSPAVADNISENLAEQSRAIANQVWHVSIGVLPSLFVAVVYLILVPLMVFFLLKDRKAMTAWVVKFLPEKKGLLSLVWKEVDNQMGNYVRGKALQILIVTAISFVTFYVLGLNYAALLAFAVGMGVLVPYLGPILVTFPLIMVAFFEWGISNQFIYVMVAFGIIQALDGNVIVPLLFSEAVNLHPVAIILSILVFGAYWGFWGVFFAIPLAILIKAVLQAWPNSPHRLHR